MLAKRIIPCLDVKAGRVVKGVQFSGHHIVGEIEALAEFYCETGADELVFYDITASCEDYSVSHIWVARVAKVLNIPFCVAGGIRTLESAAAILNAGADKVSINSPALENPDLIRILANEFGSQAVVVGIDSCYENDDYFVYQYTGDASKRKQTALRTIDWVEQVQSLGAGEIVLNCMNQDGMRKGYDIQHLQTIRKFTHIPLIASGGAGSEQHFADLFQKADVEGALAASIFHERKIVIHDLKIFLNTQNIEVNIYNE